MKEPLNQFADRLIRCGEVDEFIQGLLEKGVSPASIRIAVTSFDRAQQDREQAQARNAVRWLAEARDAAS